MDFMAESNFNQIESITFHCFAGAVGWWMVDGGDDVAVLYYFTFSLKLIFNSFTKRKMIAMATTMGCASDRLNASGFNTQTRTQNNFLSLQKMKQ